jgi:hypothetical protein
MTSWSYDFSRMRIFCPAMSPDSLSVNAALFTYLLYVAAEAFEVVTTTRRTS